MADRFGWWKEANRPQRSQLGRSGPNRPACSGQLRLAGPH